MAKLIRVLSTVILLSVGLYFYCHYAVPVLEPPARFEKRNIITSSNDPVYRYLEFLFPQDSWEIKRSRHLEIGNFHILIDDYNLSAEPIFEVKRCTFIVVSGDQSLSETQRFQRAVIIQCTDKATLQFERPPLQGGLGSSNRFLGGMLNGEIIVSGQGDPHNLNDNLKMVTRDVHINLDRIWTSANIRFSYGQSHGMGTGMQIQLLNSRSVDSSYNIKPSGSFMQMIERVTVQKLDHLTLYPTVDNTRKNNQIGLAFQNAPIELHCDGPFTFNVMDKTATFSDNVSLIHPVPDKQPDSLLCDSLHLVFNTPINSKRKSTDTSDPENEDFFGSWNLTVDRLEASGNPVVIRSPENSLEMDGKKVLITVNPLSFELDDVPGGQTVIKYKEHEIYSQNLLYLFGENGQLGALQCNSSGWIRSRIGTEGKSVRVRWLERMVFAPDLQDSSEHMVSLNNKVILEYGTEGNPDFSLYAPNVYFWLGHESQSEKPEENSISGLSLKRMQAETGVSVKSEYIIAQVKKLQLWFEKRADLQNLPGVSALNTGKTTSTGTLLSSNDSTDSQPQAPSKPYYAEGDLLQGKILLAPDKYNISEVTLKDNVWVYNNNDEEGNSKIFFKGRCLEMYDILLPHASARLSGETAQVGFDNMILYANTININRSLNKIWSDCPGSCRWFQNVLLTPEKELDKKKLVPTEIKWQKAMLFDGQTVVFNEDVKVVHENQNIQCDQLSAFLSNKIDFQNLNSNKNVEVKKILMTNNVKLENVSLTKGKQTALDCLNASKLTVDIPGKKMIAIGPGRVTTQRITSSRFNTAATNASADLTQEKNDNLIYLNIDFQNQLDVDLSVPNSQSFVFLGRVDSIYGPIKKWGDVLNSQRISELPTDAFILKCARMDIQTNYELNIPNSQNALFQPELLQITKPDASYNVSNELLQSVSNPRFVQCSTNSTAIEQNDRSLITTFVAAGSVSLEGRVYNATAEQITYESKTNQLILEGGERNVAKFYYQKVLGGYYYETSSSKIFYSLKTGAVHGEGIQDFSVFINTDNTDD